MSSVTYSALAGTVNTGLKRRSNRVLVFGPGPGPSAAFWWNAALEVAPQNLELVVHFTVLAPPAWDVVQPAGRLPGATLLKSSAKIVAAEGVPVNSVRSRVAEPRSSPFTLSASSIGVPGTKLDATWRTKSSSLVAVAPGVRPS